MSFCATTVLCCHCTSSHDDLIVFVTPLIPHNLVLVLCLTTLVLPLLSISLLVQCRLIISQMSGQSCQLFNSFFIPVAAVVGVSLVWPAYELAALGILTAFLTLAHAHYGISVVSLLKSHLHFAFSY